MYCAVPDWFPSLLSSDFFDPCEDHDGVRKNEVRLSHSRGIDSGIHIITSSL